MSKLKPLISPAPSLKAPESTTVAREGVEQYYRSIVPGQPWTNSSPTILVGTGEQPRTASPNAEEVPQTPATSTVITPQAGTTSRG